jgi:hypothetical protein
MILPRVKKGQCMMQQSELRRGNALQNSADAPQAISMPCFPKPDRSKIVPNFKRGADNPEMDLGWSEGVLPDGRPFRAEVWESDGILMLSIFLSAEGLDLSDEEDAAAYVEKMGLVVFYAEEPGCEAFKHVDDSGHEMWSVNVLLHYEGEQSAESPHKFHPYAQDPEINKRKEIHETIRQV